LSAAELAAQVERLTALSQALDACLSKPVAPPDSESNE
jgi:hypothetical protein